MTEGFFHGLPGLFPVLGGKAAHVGPQKVRIFRRSGADAGKQPFHTGAEIPALGAAARIVKDAPPDVLYRGGNQLRLAGEIVVHRAHRHVGGGSHRPHVQRGQSLAGGNALAGGQQLLAGCDHFIHGAPAFHFEHCSSYRFFPALSSKKPGRRFHRPGRKAVFRVTAQCSPA